MEVPLRTKASYNLGTHSPVPWISVGYSYTSSAAKTRSASGAPLLRGRVASQTQSLVDRAYRNPGDFHGSLGYFHRQCGPTPHGRDARPQPERSPLGADQLPGVKRHRATDLRLALHPLRTQALLYDVRGAIYRLLAALRPCTYPSVPDPGPAAARLGRTRSGSQRTGHPGGHFSRGTKRTGVCPLRYGGGGRTRHRTDAGRLD